MKNISKILILFVIAFVLGGVFVADQQGTSLWAVLTGDEKPPIVEMDKTEDNITASLPLDQGAMTVAEIVEKASPAVVNIKAKVQVSSMADNPFFNDPFFRQFFGDQFRYDTSPRYETGIGTGFLITKDGYILTNQHVIENAASVTVQLNGKNDEIPARVVGQDRELDLAVLKIEGDNYPVLKLGDSDKMKVGEWVIAIGQPYGLDHTVTAGVISATGRPITIEDRNYKNLIQTDAAINPGNSGGPLLNLRGEVIAINTAVNAQAQGIGFAIPTSTVSEVLKDLINGNVILRPFLGISMTDVNDEIRAEFGLSSDTQGVLVVEVVGGSAAAQAGVAKLDIITAIDGTKIKSSTQLQEIVAGHKVGDKITLEIIRQGNPTTLSAALQAKP
jgi:serine protease Do